MRIQKIQVFEPGDPGGDVVAEYPIFTPKDGSVRVTRWPDRPIGRCERRGGWRAFLVVPGEPEVPLALGLATKAEAVAAVVTAYHVRFRRGKSWPYQKPSRSPVTNRYQLIPQDIPWYESPLALGQLHRFLGVNRRLFDKPSEIRPYAPEES